jgi:short-subunit dehydrogenase
VPPQHIVNDALVDLQSIFIINRILIPRLRARAHRSAILNISSCTGYYISSRLGIYSSAKLALDVYSRILSQENQDKIDISSIRAFGVTTNMMKFKKGPFMVDPRSFARQSLADVYGGQITTFGHFKHKVMESLGFAGKSEQQIFALYDKLWSDARLKERK